MAFVSKLESKLGLTRADITVALFVAATTLAGFVYATFFDDRSTVAAHRELLALVARHDSILASYREQRLRELRRALAPADSVPSWRPLTSEDEAAEEQAARSARSGGGAKAPPSGPVDLNNAPRAELMSLPGVGEKTADAIIARRAHLPFRRLEEIMEIKGIGEKKYEKMKPYITVR